jgi:hypothetical protein
MKKYTRFSARASLGVIGILMKKMDIWEEIEKEVHIRQKVIKHRPIDKLKDVLINILAGGHGIVEINRRVRVDPALQRAFGRQACAEQSTISETLNACDQKNVEQLKCAVQAVYRKYGQGFWHDYEKRLQVIDVDMTGLVAGRQAEQATKGYFSGARNRRGRQLGRVLATNYAEIVTEKLYAGTVQLDQNLQELVLDAEGVLELDEARRKRTIIRLDGGGGKDADINWLLQRGYWVITKVKNWLRAKKLAQTVQIWYPDAKEPGREYGWVGAPHEYEGATRQVAVRSKKEGQWHYHILVFNLSDEMIFELAHMAYPLTCSEPLILAAALCAYDLRGGGIETANKDSKQGLGLNKRNKRRFAAQEILTLLAQLAYNLIVWVRSLLAQHNPNMARFGVLRMVRDVFQIPGSLRFDQEHQIISIRLSIEHDLAHLLQQTWRLTFPTDGVPFILGKI